MNNPPAGAIQLDMFSGPQAKTWSDPQPRSMSIDEWLSRCAELGLTSISMQHVDQADPPSWVVSVRSRDRQSSVQAWAYSLEEALGFAVEGVERDLKLK